MGRWGSKREMGREGGSESIRTNCDKNLEKGGGECNILCPRGSREGVTLKLSNIDSNMSLVKMLNKELWCLFDVGPNIHSYGFDQDTLANDQGREVSMVVGVNRHDQANGDFLTLSAVETKSSAKFANCSWRMKVSQLCVATLSSVHRVAALICHHSWPVLRVGLSVLKCLWCWTWWPYQLSLISQSECLDRKKKWIEKMGIFNSNKGRLELCFTTR